jgi:hypothetical protein
VSADKAEFADFPQTHLSSHILANHASFHAVMLISASCYTRAQDSGQSILDLLELSDIAIRETRDALKDGCRKISDPLVADIAHMASYGALFGSNANCKTHMESLTVVVSICGGFSTLDHDGLLEKIVLWAIDNTSSIV